jgi:protein tyrosine/serine phosphatase
MTHHPPSRRQVLALLAAAMVSPAFADTPRPAQWAAPVPLQGAPNLHRITPDLYRAAQPDAEGFAGLAALGIRHVISLRQTVDDAPLAKGSGLILHRLPMMSRHVGARNGAQVVKVMRLIAMARADGPVLLHCHHGADRTGTIAAVFRMVDQGWTHAAALDELLNGGYGFHTLWRNIPRYVETVDIADLRRRI